MAKGDNADVIQRLFGWYPSRWFPQQPGTRIYATTAGYAASWTHVWQQVVYARHQTRIATSTDGWLELTAYDFFGKELPRRPNELDGAYSVRIRREVLRPRNTRDAITSVLVDTTGQPPELFEPYNPGDCGGWDIAMGWDSSGCWGDLDLMFQIFINAFRPTNQGVPSASGWDSRGGGWDVGAIEWTDETMIVAPVTDRDVYTAIAGVIPAGMIAWVSLETSVQKGIAPLGAFRLNINTLG